MTSWVRLQCRLGSWFGHCHFEQIPLLSGQDALVDAQVLRAGKSLAFGEIDLRSADDGRSVCRASTTYALL